MTGRHRATPRRRFPRPNLDQLPRLAQQRRLALSEPCPWCHVAVDEPCRARRGDGAELTRYVHPARAKAIRDRQLRIDDDGEVTG